MARNRMIRPEFWSDEKIAKLSDRAKLLFIGMWNFADDEGRIRYNPVYIRSCIFPYADISAKIMQKIMIEVEGQNLINIYVVNGETYAEIKNFKKHQVINRPQPSKIPTPDKFTDYSLNTHGAFTDEEKRKEVKLKEEKETGGQSSPPRTIIPDCDLLQISPEELKKLQDKYGEAEVQRYCLNLNDYIGSKGKKYRSHYLTVRAWMRRDNIPEIKVPNSECTRCRKKIDSIYLKEGLCAECFELHQRYLIQKSKTPEAIAEAQRVIAETKAKLRSNYGIIVPEPEGKNNVE